jgi:hypothetical protein
VLVEADSHLVLPDCIALIRTAGTSTYAPYLLNSHNDIEVVLMPLSAKQLLIGSRDAIPQLIDITEINLSSAKCAINFFVSSRADATLNAVIQQIGNVSNASVMAMADDSMASMLESRNKEDVAEILNMTGSPATGKVFSYSVQFQNCDDQAKAERIAKAVEIVVNAVARQTPVYQVESIIFASDYAQALRDLDFGFERITPPSPTVTEYGTGIASTQLIRRRDGIKFCIVLQSQIGDALLDNPQGDRFSLAAYTLANMVAHASFSNMVETTLPGTLLTPAGNALDDFLNKFSSSVLSTYYAARMTASIYPEQRNAFFEFFHGALKAAQEKIPLARAIYQSEGNLDAFVHETTILLRHVLIHAASLLGHLNASETPLLDDQETEHLLSQASLVHWISVYQRDLQTVYERRGRWNSVRELLSINIHVERLLWQFRVFTWGNRTE